MIGLIGADDVVVDSEDLVDPGFDDPVSVDGPAVDVDVDLDVDVDVDDEEALGLPLDPVLSEVLSSRGLLEVETASALVSGMLSVEPAGVIVSVVPFDAEPPEGILLKPPPNEASLDATPATSTLCDVVFRDGFPSCDPIDRDAHEGSSARQMALT